MYPANFFGLSRGLDFLFASFSPCQDKKRGLLIHPHHLSFFQ